MTIVIPKPDLIDKLLRLIGKKRGVVVHGETTDPNSTQTYYAPKKESPLRALLRPACKPLPNGMIDIFTLQFEDEMAERKAQKQVWMPFALSGLISQELPRLVRHR
jgi:hypothetical protein